MKDDYADMVNPYVRAEQEAHERGFWEGCLSGIFYTLVALIAAAMILFSMNAHAEVSWVALTWSPIKASDCGGTISVCQNNATEGTWTCFCVR